ncbi:hypothetical protein [Fibrobacter sp. UWT3]|uniref:hypothetical protein n=1 Tax=Fibrobacter sp. UWT3 TaxID=1896225 RepID=UPI0015968D9F|nr:hypothetical protein [Fibrobacter sp. UWT3]
MTKSIIFTFIASLESLSIILVLIFKYNGLFMPFLGFSFLFWIWSRIMRSSLNAYLFASLFIPIPWLILWVIPQIIQSTGTIWDSALVLILCPCMGLAAWFEVFLNRIIHGKPMIISWPFSHNKDDN